MPNRMTMYERTRYHDWLREQAEAGAFHLKTNTEVAEMANKLFETHGTIIGKTVFRDAQEFGLSWEKPKQPRGRSKQYEDMREDIQELVDMQRWVVSELHALKSRVNSDVASLFSRLTALEEKIGSIEDVCLTRVAEIEKGIRNGEAGVD